MIRVIISDLDGVLTDGGMYTSEHGLIFKKFHTRDASAAKWLHDNGVPLYIVTGGSLGNNSRINDARANVMYLAEPIMHEVYDKLEAVMEIACNLGITLDEIAYIGDDFHDITALKAVKYSACPNDALFPVTGLCEYVSIRDGGCGVLGHLVDFWNRSQLFDKGE